MSERAAIYGLFDAAGNLLYVGRTKRLPLARWREHRESKPWWGDVARCVLDLVAEGSDPIAAERRAILAANPRHNLERRPVRSECRPASVWEPLPDALFDRIDEAGHRYEETGAATERDALAAAMYDAFLLGCRPRDVGRACGMLGDQARRMTAAHAKRNPDLPALPRRHGQRPL